MGAAPCFFSCPVERRERNGRFAVDGLTFGERRIHAVTLTGRKRPNPSHNRGRRSSSEEREYTCLCGHVGWSRHKDLERMEQRHGA